jgi:adenylylsulfate kinase-like enzyme
MENIFPIENKIKIANREKLLGQKSFLVWFTGL